MLARPRLRAMSRHRFSIPLQEPSLGLRISSPPRWRRPRLRRRARAFRGLSAVTPRPQPDVDRRHGQDPAAGNACRTSRWATLRRRAGDRIRLADLPALRGLQQGDVPAAQERTTSTPARCASSSANSRAIRWMSPVSSWRAALATTRPSRQTNCCSPSRTNGPSSTSRSSR